MQAIAGGSSGGVQEVLACVLCLVSILCVTIFVTNERWKILHDPNK